MRELRLDRERLAAEVQTLQHHLVLKRMRGVRRCGELVLVSLSVNSQGTSRSGFPSIWAVSVLPGNIFVSPSQKTPQSGRSTRSGRY